MFESLHASSDSGRRTCRRARMTATTYPPPRTIVAPNKNQFEAWNGGESVHYVDHADRYDRGIGAVHRGAARTGPADSASLVPRRGRGVAPSPYAAARIADSAVGVDFLGAADGDHVRAGPHIGDRQRRVRRRRRPDLRFAPARSTLWSASSGSCSSMTRWWHSRTCDARSLPTAGLHSSAGRASPPTNGSPSSPAKWPSTSRSPSSAALQRDPGMFALMDQDETKALLEAAGFTDMAFERACTDHPDRRGRHG